MLHGQVLGVVVRARPHVLVQGGEDLRVQHLEAADSVHHAFQLLEKKKKTKVAFYHNCQKLLLQTSREGRLRPAQ